MTDKHDNIPAEDALSEVEDAPSKVEDALSEVGSAVESDNPEDTSAVVDTETELQQQLRSMEEEVEKYRELSLRAKADAENAVKRAAREIDKIRKYAGEDIVIRLFEVKDNLERGLQSQGGGKADIQKGMELTLKSLSQMFSDLGVEEINPVQQSFDPELHQAMSMTETGENPPNSVIKVLQKGYRLHDRLLRPAMVVVEKTMSLESEEPVAGEK